MRRRVQRLLDARLDLAPALIGSGQPLLGARARLPSLGQRLDRGGRGLVERALLGLGFLQPSAAVLRSASACESCDSSARRLSSISSGASASASSSGIASARRSPSDLICAAAFSAREVQFRRSTAIASSRRARVSASRFSPS